MSLLEHPEAQALLADFRARLRGHHERYMVDVVVSPERIVAEVARVSWRKEAARIYKSHKATGTFPPRRPRPDTS